ncbi:ArsR/SmtB family transcription factor [Streptomyces griseicoloratus]|uniref:ArsR/SmtB family transcription factor n=1 Tax=Streptomyces griseicoloratus TaxID=2752516 RepID=UPI001CB6F890|nr:metalloregulator ArsR/SmtB family transcription factor [Streptomyces griseicoloratus]
MGHGADAKTTATARERLETVGAADVAATLQALATPSRLRILARLQEGPCAATELADAVGMEQSACSHQLRLLRNLGLVTGERRGRSVIYALYDNHVAELLEQALYHVEHLRLGLRDAPATVAGARSVLGRRQSGSAATTAPSGRRPA